MLAPIFASLSFLLPLQELSKASLAPEAPTLPAPFHALAASRPDGSRATLFFGDALDPAAPRPLLVYVEGSGAQSLFYRLEDGRLAVGMLGLVAGHARSEYVVAAVEKRGVRFGDMGTYGAGQGASAEYTRHATLEARAADVRLLLTSALALPGIDPGRVLLLGHSEGADVAARVAAEDERVTHVAFLSGGGAPQFFDMFVLTRAQMRESGASEEAIEEALRALEEDVRRIVAAPESDAEFFQGHAYRRWASFATQASADSLVEAQARLFVAHGTADRSVPIESFDYLVARLLCAGRGDAVIRRYPGRDHSFIPVGAEPGYEGFLEVVDEVLEWARGG